MFAGTRVSLGGFALLFATALAMQGCDAGGLLVVESKGTRPVNGPSATELTSSGTFASNSKYRLFYVMGQPSPQGVGTSPNHQLNGGLTGAVHSR